MQRYPVRRDHVAALTLPGLAAAAREAFGAADTGADSVVTRFGAIEELRAKPHGKELEIELRMDPHVGADVAADTVRRYNRFLEATTGYSSKERAKRLRKSAGATDPQG